MSSPIPLVKQLTDSFSRMKSIDAHRIASILDGIPSIGEHHRGDRFKIDHEKIVTILDSASKDVSILLQLSSDTNNLLKTHLEQLSEAMKCLIKEKDEKAATEVFAQLSAIERALQTNGIHTWHIMGDEFRHAIRDAQNERMKISEERTRSEETRKSLEEMLSKTTASALQESFEERRKSIAAARWWWLGACAIIILACVGYGWYIASTLEETLRTTKDAVDNGAFDKLVARSILAVPIALAVGFVLTQYGRERRLEETYAHKNAIASVMKAFGELLRDDGQARASVLQKAADMMFDNPTSQSNKKPGIIEQLTSKRHFEQIREIIKEVKALGIATPQNGVSKKTRDDPS